MRVLKGFSVLKHWKDYITITAYHVLFNILLYQITGIITGTNALNILLFDCLRV